MSKLKDLKKENQFKQIELSDLSLSFEKVVFDDRQSSYLKSYPLLMDWFQNSEITGTNICLGIHLIYGWMPKIPVIGEITSDQIDLLKDVKNNSYQLKDDELSVLIPLTNNSVVGISKYLHFLCPEKYAIWDSKIANNTLHKYSYSKCKSPVYYNDYLELLNQTIKNQETEFSQLRKKVYNRIGSVSDLRVIELALYLQN